MTLPNPTTVFWDDWTLLAVQSLGLLFLVIYVWKTWQMASATRDAVEESKRARLEALAPRIVVYFDPRETFVAYVVTENAGNGTAADVTYHFEPPLESPEGEKAVKFFTIPKTMIAPGMKLPHWFATWPSYLNSSAPKRYEVTVKYRGIENNQHYEVKHILDVESLMHRVTSVQKGIHDLVSTVEKSIDTVQREIHEASKYAISERVQNRFGGFRETDPKFAFAALETAWAAFQSANEAENVFLSWEEAVEYLRREAMGAARAARYAELPQEYVAACDKLVLELSRYYRYGDEGWTSGIQEAFSVLQVLIRRRSP